MNSVVRLAIKHHRNTNRPIDLRASATLPRLSSRSISIPSSSITSTSATRAMMMPKAKDTDLRRRTVGRPSSDQTIPTKKNLTKSTRRYPIRKRFIFESYLDLFTANQVCLLFRFHDGLSAKDWNSIRGQIKNLSSRVPTQPAIPFGEFKFEEEKLEDHQAGPNNHDHHRHKSIQPRIEVLRTGMILPVFKNLLKESKIKKNVYHSLVRSSSPKSSALDPIDLPPSNDQKPNRHPRVLSGSLFSITQSEFDPTQIKKALEIIQQYSKAPNDFKAQKPSPSSSSSKFGKSSDRAKIEFVIGFVDRQKVIPDPDDLNHMISNLNSLRSSRLQILNLLTHHQSNLLSHLSFSGSKLTRTLNAHLENLKNPKPNEWRVSD